MTYTARLLFPLRSHSDGRGEGQGEVTVLGKPPYDFFRMHWDHEPVRSLVAANRRRMIPPLLGERAGVRESLWVWKRSI